MADSFIQRTKLNTLQYKEAVKEVLASTPAVRRNEQAKRDTTRNVQVKKNRTSNMPGSPTNQKFDSSQKSTDQIFNESYAKQGLQPSYATPSDDKTPRYQQPDQITRSTQATYSNSMVTPGVQTQKRRIRLRRKNGKLAPLARVRVTGVNFWLWGWGFLFWASFQVPFALLSAGFFGLAGWYDSLYESIEPFANDKGFFEKVVDSAEVVLLTIAQKVAEVIQLATGINIEIFMPHNIFFLTHLVVFAFGMIALLIVYFTYLVSFLRPLSGSGAGLKIGALLISIIGYSIPILNIFPWFIVWTGAVWLYPK